MTNRNHPKHPDAAGPVHSFNLIPEPSQGPSSRTRLLSCTRASSGGNAAAPASGWGATLPRTLWVCHPGGIGGGPVPVPVTRCLLSDLPTAFPLPGGRQSMASFCPTLTPGPTHHLAHACTHIHAHSPAHSDLWPRWPPEGGTPASAAWNGCLGPLSLDLGTADPRTGSGVCGTYLEGGGYRVGRGSPR